jgi:hypothetical protein
MTIIGFIHNYSDVLQCKLHFKDFREACHLSCKSDKHVTQITLKWVHITIFKAKRTLLRIHHLMKSQYLQVYLDKFCYRLIKRYFGEQLFERLELATISVNKIINRYV